MSNSTVPVTQYATSFTGILPTAAVGKSAVQKQIWQQTTYPNGSVVTKIYYDTVEIYNSQAVVTKYNQPNQIDMMV